MRIVEDPFRVALESVDVARASVGKPANGYAPHSVRTLGVFVLPRDVVRRAGGQDLDLVTDRNAFGDETAVILRAAENLSAVALDDETDFQRSFLKRTP